MLLTSPHLKRGRASANSQRKSDGTRRVAFPALVGIGKAWQKCDKVWIAPAPRRLRTLATKTLCGRVLRPPPPHTVSCHTWALSFRCRPFGGASRMRRPERRGAGYCITSSATTSSICVQQRRAREVRFRLQCRNNTPATAVSRRRARV